MNSKILLGFLVVGVFGAVLVSGLGGKSVVTVRDYQKKNQKSRIGGDDVAGEGTRPYQVALFLEYASDSGFCGGVLISPRCVLTAAHCHTNVEDGEVQRFTVVLGAHNIFNPNEAGAVTMISGVNITYPHYDPITTQHNLAIVVLPRAVEFTDRIQPVHLLPQTHWGSNHVAVSATVSGWGMTDGTESLTSFLRMGTMPVLLNNYCGGFFANLITEDMLCTSGDLGVSTCRGDSGTPLTIVFNGVDTLIGIASFTTVHRCGSEFASVFTRISSHMEWILETVESVDGNWME